MLSLMVITFMFCWLPYHLYHTFELNSSMEFENPNIGKYIYLCIYWIAMSSSAYNPVIYCFANERFRIGFRYVFRWMPMIQCSRENYEYSQLFPEKLRSMAITVQLNKTSREKNSRPLHRSYNSAAFSRCCNGAGGGAQQARRTYSARRINLKPDDV
nr:7TM GPCR domain containing protein [Haemonchus contortus]